MKEITLEQLAQETLASVEAAQRERVLVTRDGKPLALLVGLENKDEEDLQLETSVEFWKMIEERRREPTVPWEEVKAALLADEQSS
jgi:antitoxin (DNA-binding transcriptional repressor) of toxin-antitoxin stability system